MTTAGSMRQKEKIEKKKREKEPVNINRKMYSKPKPSQQPIFFLVFVICNLKALSGTKYHRKSRQFNILANFET